VTAYGERDNTFVFEVQDALKYSFAFLHT
jgi:hypothetical protein